MDTKADKAFKKIHRDLSNMSEYEMSELIHKIERYKHKRHKGEGLHSTIEQIQLLEELKNQGEEFHKR
ncbi:hypothetical protein LCFBJUUZ_CDS0147 [Staphylococcus phage PG-2021_76]|uniref:Uncharacterized protein n=1 Tax=Mammaliicoccus phage MSShimriz1 TaxID=3230127 RepID=A0AAU8GRX2_9VIRU